MRPEDRSQIDDLFRIAGNHIGDSLPVVEENEFHFARSVIRLHEYGVWASRLGLPMPAEFPGPVDATLPARATLAPRVETKADDTELVVLPAVHLAPRNEPVMWIGRKRDEPRFFLSSPDWSFWGKLGRLPLADVILLSVNLAPETEPPTTPTGLEKLQLFKSVLDAEGVRRLDRRTRIVLSSAEDLQFADGDEGGLASLVRLRDFRGFADAKGLELPAGFPPGSRSAPQVKDLTTKERTTLLTIIGGIAKATDFDISQPTIAAKAIVKALDDNGAKIGQRTVENALNEVANAIERKGY
jgi:hypothetical protein